MFLPYPLVSRVFETPVNGMFVLEMEQGSLFGLDNRNQQGSIFLQIITKFALEGIFGSDKVVFPTNCNKDRIEEIFGSN